MEKRIGGKRMTKKTNKQKTHSEEKDFEEQYTFMEKMKQFFKRNTGYVIASFHSFRRSPMTLFFVIAYPVVMTMIFGAIFSQSSGEYSYDLYIQVEGDEGYYYEIQGFPVFFNFTEDMLDSIEELENSENKSLIVTHYVPLEDNSGDPINPGTYLEEEGGSICLVIPYNFTEKIFTEPPVEMKIVKDKTDDSTATVQQIIEQITYYMNLAVNNIRNATNPSFNHMNIDIQDIYVEQDILYFEFLMAGMICVTMMNSSITGTLQRYVNFRKRGIYSRLATTPMTKADILISETFWQYFLSWISFFATVIATYLMFSLPHGNLLWIFGIFHWTIIPILLVGVLCFTGLALIVARFAKNPEAAAGAGNFLTFPMMFLSGIFYDVSGIPVIATISKFIPLTYLADALRAAMITKQTNLLWTNLGIASIFGVVIFVIGVFLTKITDE
jgi:ABC-2 type transport system permease protein